MSIKIITSKSEMRSYSRSKRAQSKTLALIPTMGYLHQGHLSLVHQSKSLADVIIVSIYVNPGQFAPSEDLSTYPSDFAGDLRKLEEIGGVDCVFCPKNLYDYGGENEHDNKDGSCVKSGHESWVRVERLEKGLCGKSRPVFFRGVATVVTKLFNIVEPDVALFGKKDYQQWKVICRMVRDLDFGIEIVGGEIVREEDGLAMSSRNVHLSPDERGKALSIYKSMSEAKNAAQNGKTKSAELAGSIVQAIAGAGGKVDYVEIVEPETLKPVDEITSPAVICAAAWFGTVRLIDNMEINI